MDDHVSLTLSLHDALRELSANPYPYVAGPDSLKKRASVALVLRIQPQYAHWPPADAPVARDLDSFFAQDWVKHGDPEVVFIKRAARKGDRWTSHIALPGGRRDPEDADDQAAAIRETAEEVGIDLSHANAIAVGNLPQRVVTTLWGKVSLMILCPYVFLLTRHAVSPLRLQPTEVASTHWVPLRALLAPEQRTVSYEDVSNRLANQETGVKRWMMRALVGQMVFSALHLLPSESLYCAASPADDTSELAPSFNTPSWLAQILWQRPRPVPSEQPLILWGLTLGVMADFLDLLPPHSALTLWAYPTFTPLDVKLSIWAMTYRFRERKTRELELGYRTGPPAVEVGLDAVSLPKTEAFSEVSRTSRIELKSSAIGAMLDGYYDIVRQAVAVALLGRATAVAVLGAWLWVRYRRR